MMGRMHWAVAVLLGVSLAAVEPVEASRGAGPARSAKKVVQRARHAARKVREMPRPDRTLITATRLRRSTRKGSWKPARLEISTLRPVHGTPTVAIERKIDRRAANLRSSRRGILARNLVDGKTLDRHAPSVAAIRVIRHRGNYYVMDGNSRVRAVRKAFPSHSGLMVEVKLLDHPSPATARLLDKLLTQRGRH